MKILGTGLTGLIGSRTIELLSDFSFTSISRKKGADIVDKNSLIPFFDSFEGDWVLHMGAKADVDSCETDRDLGVQGEAWRINVIGTQNMAELAAEYNKKLIYISTDFVFDGEKPEGQGYIEEDRTRPINWYGETKFQGEQKIKEVGGEYLILRIAYPYGLSSAPKKDFVRSIAERLKEGKPINGISDHIFVPTYIDDIAYSLHTLISQNTLGTFHLVGSEALTPYDASLLIANAIGINPEVIGKTTRAEYFKGKALRPFNLYLENDRIKNLGIQMKTFEQGLETMYK